MVLIGQFKNFTTILFINILSFLRPYIKYIIFNLVHHIFNDYKVVIWDW